MIRHFCDRCGELMTRDASSHDFENGAYLVTITARSSRAISQEVPTTDLCLPCMIEIVSGKRDRAKVKSKQSNTAQSVRRVLEMSSKPLPTHEVRAILQAGGRPVTDSQISTVLSSMKARGLVERNDSGWMMTKP